jgi:uncharacterized delta-60 repeat protein
MKTPRLLILSLLFALFASLPAAAQTPGTIDSSFNPGANSVVRSLAVQADGKILVGGYFTTLGGQSRSNIARLNADGTIDSSFNPGANDLVDSLAVQADGKILVGGQFTTLGGQSRSYIARLNADGTIDSSFNPGANSTVYSLAVQADGKILVGGYFTTLGGQYRSYIARLNADGSIDSSFNPGANSTVLSLALQVDGKILVGGSFSTLGGHYRSRIARLNSDGSIDPFFNPGAHWTVYSLAVQADGKILLGGEFGGIGNQYLSNIARLNADGSIDSSFNPGAVYNNPVLSMALQADGKILVGGWFATLGGESRSNIARLNADGSIDPSFNPGADGGVLSLVLQADGKILSGGQFTTLGGQSRSYIARLHNNPATQTLAVTGTSQIDWTRGGSAPEVEQVTFDYWNGSAWISLGSATRVAGGWRKTGLSLPLGGQIRARGRTTGGIFNASSGIIEQIFPVIIPTVTTTSITGVTSNSASGGGNVTATGGASVTERGVVFATTQTPTLASGTKVVSGSGTGSFTAGMTALAPGTTYYVRAYATNSVGTGYGSQVSFTTLTTLPTVTTATMSGVTSNSATGGGNVTATGGATVTERGVVFATTTTPTLASGTKVTSGSGTGTFTASLTGLAPGTTYYVRAYATNSVGTGYGSQVSFTTLATLPTVTTASISGVTSNSATSGGNVTASGGATVTERGVVFATTQTPTLASGTKVTSGSGTGSFTASLPGLAPATTYYVRAFATNSVGTAYGSELSFTTQRPPDLALEAPLGHDVANGGGSLDFGQSPPSQPTDQALAIRNDGGLVLTGISASITGEDAAQFSLHLAPPATLAPGTSTGFTLRFTPSSAGVKTATLSIASNDPDENPFTLALTGLGNTPPVFAGYLVATAFETAAPVSLGKMLSKATDADGDVLTVGSAGPASEHGGTAVLQAGSVLYTPAAGFSGSDSFAVTIADAHGATVQGVVTVSVGPAPDSGGLGHNPPRITLLAAGRVGIAFHGIPGRAYRIQRSPDLSPGSWQTIATVTAGENGALAFTDENPPPGNAFYRLGSP